MNNQLKVFEHEQLNQLIMEVFQERDQKETK